MSGYFDADQLPTSRTYSGLSLFETRSDTTRSPFGVIGRKLIRNGLAYADKQSYRFYHQLRIMYILVEM